MKLEKGQFVKFSIFMLTLLIFLPGIQSIKREATSYSGVIESIDKDAKFIVVNGAKLLISENTDVVNEKGNILKTSDLNLKLPVVVEGLPSPEGFSAKRIVVTTPKKK